MTDWQTGKTISAFSLSVLTAITFTTSYGHGVEAARLAGSNEWSAALTPLIPDLSLLSGSVALAYGIRVYDRRSGWAMASLLFGLATTLGLNAASGWDSGLGGVMVSVIAPIAMFFAAEALISMFRRESVTEAATCGHGAALDLAGAAETAARHMRDCLGEPLDADVIADKFKLSKKAAVNLINHIEASKPQLEVVK